MPNHDVTSPPPPANLSSTSVRFVPEADVAYIMVCEFTGSRSADHQHRRALCAHVKIELSLPLADYTSLFTAAPFKCIE